MTDVLIIDYGLCNLDSVKRAVELCGGRVEFSDDPRALKSASKVILPGVASFFDSMAAIRGAGWDRALQEEVVSKGVPLLGICLGMQLLATEGIEGSAGEVVPGLNIIPGSIRLLERKAPGERIPHVGWNGVNQTRPHPMWKGIPSGKDFYFVHSYQFVAKNEGDILGRTDYCGGFTSVVGKGSVFGTQFHTEKSQKVGLQLIKNFLAWDGSDA